MALFAFSAVSFSSCSSDSDDYSFDAPKYESAAVAFTIPSTEQCDYESIEFTESGNYIITPRSRYYAQARNAETKKSMVFFNSKIATRAYGREIIHGKYTLKGDNVYELEGFGTITVVKNGNETATLMIQENGSQPFEIRAEQHKDQGSSSLTNTLCRTWEFSKIRLQLYADGRVVFDKKADFTFEGMKSIMIAMVKKLGGSASMITDEMIQEELDDMMEDAPKEVIFTRAGTYMVVYQDESLAVARWRWENESKGIARYSWDYSDFNHGGLLDVDFDGKYLTISESDDDWAEEDEVPFDGQRFTWYLSEKK